MYENIILTTSDNINDASTFAQQYGGVVIVSCTVPVGQTGSFSESKTGSTTCEVYGLKVVDGYENYESTQECCGTTSGYSSVKNVLSFAGVMINPIIYLISSSSDEYASLHEAAEIINGATELNVWIIEKNGKPKFFTKH